MKKKYSKKQLAYIVGFLSCGVNILLFFLKYWIGESFHSIAIKADAWHTLSDSITSIVFIFGFWISHQKPDIKHPYGHGRAESIAAIIIGTLLAVVAFNFLKESIIKLKYPIYIHYNTLGLIIFSSSILIKEGMALLSFNIAKKLKSKALKADGWHHRSDAITTIIIVVGILLGRTTYWIDGVLGILISLFILYTSYKIIKETASLLIGKEADPSLITKVKAITQKITPAASTFHHLHVHHYGDHIEMTFHLKFPKSMKINEAHKTATQIEKTINKKLKIAATIHIEPAD